MFSLFPKGFTWPKIMTGPLNGSLYKRQDFERPPQDNLLKKPLTVGLKNPFKV